MALTKGTVRLTIDVSPELHKMVKTLAVEDGMSIRDLVIEAIEEKIGGIKSPRKQRN